MPNAGLRLRENAGFPLMENPFYLMSRNRLSISEQDWQEGLPTGRSGNRVSIETTVFVPSETLNEPDVETPVRLEFIGRFSSAGGGWSGGIKKLQFYFDDVQVGTLRLGRHLDISEIVNVTDPHSIWQALSLDGFKGALTAEDDYFSASEGADRLRGGAGGDTILANGGDDRVLGNNGSDYLYGGRGNDRLVGGSGNDTLDGGDGDDVLIGGSGDDHFREEQSAGQDTWTGGAGADRFEISRAGGVGAAATVTDFSREEGDQIDLSGDDAFRERSFDEFIFIGTRAFTETEDRYEIRMENGVVEVDSDWDGEADQSIVLTGHDSFSGVLDWLILPEGFEFG